MVKTYNRKGNPISAQQWTGDIKPFVKDTINSEYFDFWLDSLVENDIKVDSDGSLIIKDKGKYKYIVNNTDYIIYKESIDEDKNSVISIKIFTEEEFNEEYEIVEDEGGTNV